MMVVPVVVGGGGDYDDKDEVNMEKDDEGHQKE